MFCRHAVRHKAGRLGRGDRRIATGHPDYQKLKTEFGSLGALEVVLQTCNFAFMNRFTDGLRLPSEDEAIKVYREVYGKDFERKR